MDRTKLELDSARLLKNGPYWRAVWKFCLALIIGKAIWTVMSITPRRKAILILG